MDSKGPKPAGMGVPPMMREMMEKMGCTGEFGPAMCRSTTASAGRAAGTAEHATAEVQTLFEEWARRMEGELLAALKARGPLDLAALAAALEIGPESALYLLGKLVREGKATLGSIRATGV